MNLKIFVLLIAWMTAPDTSPDLADIRIKYRKASNSEETTKKLFDDLSGIGKNDNLTLVAYKGAVTALVSKYAEDFKDKKFFFKEGREWLEHAVENDKSNVEIRCVRLSVQENVPKITGYTKNIEEDKKFILENYNSMADSAARDFVKGYVSQSGAFTNTEKQLF